MSQEDANIQVLGKAFAILEYLSQNAQAKGPTEIAGALQISKTTVHRVLSSLHALGYVEKQDGGTYRIGVKLVEIASHHINNLELQTEARPILNELHADLQMVVHLGILDGWDVVYVEKMDILPNIRLYAQIGVRVPAYCSSLGKCLLASLSGEELEYLFSENTLEKHTPNTIVTLPEMKQHLRKVRAQGWGMDNEEYILGNRCIAAPVFDYRGETIAAVSASGPTSLLTEDKIATVSHKVIQAADSISRRLMYVG